MISRLSQGPYVSPQKNITGISRCNFLAPSFGLQEKTVSKAKPSFLSRFGEGVKVGWQQFIDRRFKNGNWKLTLGLATIGTLGCILGPLPLLFLLGYLALPAILHVGLGLIDQFRGSSNK